MEQVVFAIIVLAIGLIRVAMNVAEKTRNREAAKRATPTAPQPNAPVQRAPAETDDERIRRLMEALGVPANTASPKTMPRTVLPKAPRPPRRKVMPVDPFPRPRADVPFPSAPLPRPPVVVAAPAAPPAPVVRSTPQPPFAAPPSAPTPIAPAFEVHDLQFGSDAPAIIPSPTGAASPLVRQDAAKAEQNWAARLATAANLRDAIVLREIFGPPRSLQPSLSEFASQ